MLGDYMELPCAKCGKMKAISLDCYENKNGIVIVKYYCEHCKHKGRRTSRC
jgi:hypothetical protein